MTLLITAIICSLFFIFVGGIELLAGVGILVGAMFGVVVVWNVLL